VHPFRLIAVLPKPSIKALTHVHMDEKHGAQRHGQTHLILKPFSPFIFKSA
jgi:hypothetical protein